MARTSTIVRFVTAMFPAESLGDEAGAFFQNSLETLEDVARSQPVECWRAGNVRPAYARGLRRRGRAGDANRLGARRRSLGR